MPRVKENRGSVSLLVLLVFSFLAWQGMKAFIKVSAFERMVAYDAHKTKATYLADSGLEWAMASLEENQGWDGGRLQLTNGEIIVTVTQHPEGFTIKAIGISGPSRQQRESELELNHEGRITQVHYTVQYD